MKQKYLKYSDVKRIITEKELNYLILLGQRSNGKSYACKELALRDAWETGSEFTYLRRRKTDTADYANALYWADMMKIPEGKKKNAIEDITGGVYNSIDIYKKGIYFANTDGEKITRGPRAGYVHALSGLEGLKSLQFPKVKYILFEEFIATGLYLYQEPDKLQNYVSTVLRDRPGCVFMIGNTISRIVPYFSEWQLDEIPRQKQGTVDVYRFTSRTDDGEEVETTIGVFLCESLNFNSGMFFGSSAKMITGGEWDRQPQPRLSKDIDDYRIVYTMVFKHSDKAMYLMRLLSDPANNGSYVWYVEPKTTPIQDGTRVVCPDMVENKLYTRDFTPITAKESTALLYLEMGKIAYSDNLTGTEFKTCWEQLHKR